MKKIENQEFQNLFNQFKSNRPNLSISSINTYVSTIHNIYKKIENTLEYPTKEYFMNNCDKVIDYLNQNNISLNRKKLILASIVVLINDTSLNCYKKYASLMINESNKYNHLQTEQKKTHSQVSSWMSQEQIQKKYEEINKNIKTILKIPNEDLTNTDFRKLNDWMIVSLYTLIPPRRLQDYIFMLNPHYTEKNNEFNPNESNFFDRKRGFVFNNYKTSKTYGSQIVSLPIQLKRNLNEYLKKISGVDTKWLIFTDKIKQFTPSSLNKRLYQIFDKKGVSVNILRHSYITENVLKNMPYKLIDLQHTAEQMGHNVQQQLLYKKF